MDAREYALAAVQREIEEIKAANAAVEAGLAHRGGRRATGCSIVYSVRLDPGEVAALEQRAAALGLKPTVLARNLIRSGLRRAASAQVHEAVERLDGAVRELRTLVD